MSITLLRVLPFLAVIIALKFALNRGRISNDNLCLQAPVSYTRYFLWCFLFLLFVLSSEFLLFKNGLLEVTHWHHNVPNSIIRIIGIVALAPIAEELLFRGLFLHKLTQWKLNNHFSIFIQAFVFVLLHSFAYENTLSSNIGIAQSFLDAVLYGYARFSTKSIYTSMTMHATGNLIAVVEQFIF